MLLRARNLEESLVLADDRVARVTEAGRRERGGGGKEGELDVVILTLAKSTRARLRAHFADVNRPVIGDIWITQAVAEPVSINEKEQEKVEDVSSSSTLPAGDRLTSLHFSIGESSVVTSLQDLTGTYARLRW